MTQTSLRFLGIWPGWLGVVAALVLAGIAVRWYKRRLAGGPSSPLRRLLPWLRGAAVFFLVLMLTGPVLHRRRVVGELSRVIFALDASRSMERPDPNLPPDRRWMLANRLGLLRSEAADSAVIEAVSRLRIARAAAAAVSPAMPNVATAAQQRETLLGAVEGAAAAIGRLPDGVRSRLAVSTGLIYERWNNLPGTSLADLLRSNALQSPPTSLSEIERLEYRPNPPGENYGGRIRGYLTPPETGAYVFWISGDDACEFRLSTDEQPEHARRVAHVEGWTPYGVWDKERHQASERISLHAGRRYYFEVLHKQGTGDSHVAVGWQRPRGRVERPIPASVLSPYLPDRALDPKTLFHQQVLAPLKAASALFDKDPLQGAEALAATGLVAERWETALRSAWIEWLEHSRAQDETAAPALAALDRMPRWERVRELLLGGPAPLVRRLAEQHEVEVYAVRHDEIRLLWHSAGGEPSSGFPSLLPAAPDGPATDLTRAAAVVGAVDAARGDRPAAVILVSDGGHNIGPPPASKFAALAAQGVQTHTLLFGDAQILADIAIAAIEAPVSIHYKDQLRGTVRLRDHLPPSQPLRLLARCNNEVLWERTITSEGTGLRSLPFEISLESVVESRIGGAGSETPGVPLLVDFAVETAEPDVEPRNNVRSHAVFAVRRKNALLLLDDRPRWEWRYLRNLFERDPTWQVDAAVLDPDGRWPREPERRSFPPTREDLFAYDVIFWGDLSPDACTPEQQEWLREFVGTRGGGIILVDGDRHHLRKLQGTPLEVLLPVDFETAGDESSVTLLRRTPAGEAVAALELGTDPEEPTRAGWNALPPPRRLSPGRARPGTETLVEAVTASASRPAVVFRHYGAGRVLYLAFDETWRWRYRVEDLYHGRFWNQVVRWMMEPPYSVVGSRASLAMDAADYLAPARPEFRVRLRDEQGRPRTDATAWLDILREGRRVAVIPLTPEATGSGVYRAMADPVGEGSYQARLRVLDEPETVTPLELTFHVRAGGEDEWLRPEADAALMKEIALTGGGSPLWEEDADQLIALLEPLSRGRVIEGDVVLWQSYGWLAVIAVLLTLEWILRKREGLP